jgi:hypothetical protein
MNYWLFLPFGYLFSILIETPVLMVGLSKRHPMSRRVFAGIWLTACTYPVVCLVLPALIGSEPEKRWLYLLVAETFAPVAEWNTRSMWRDLAAIVVANLASFLLGEVAQSYLLQQEWFQQFFFYPPEDPGPLLSG